MKVIISCCFLIILGLFPDIALAQELSSSGVMNDVLNRFHSAASTWAPTIEGAASRLFWTLVTISMVWTFGMMALRKADIGEFFAELVRFTIFTGFYWWLLSNATHGMNIAGSIVDSLQQLGAEAGGLGSSKLGPSSILDMGFELYDRTVEATSELSWKEFATALMMELMALAVLVVLAIISVNLLLLLAASWILLYAGVFFLGFGGSRWTSDMAINYYKSILGIASQLLSMVLIVAIGKQFLLDYHNKISENMASQELAVMLVISLCLLFLVNKVPPMISSLVSGGNIGTMGIGSFGAGAAMGTVMTAASMGAAGMKIAGGAIASGAANATSGISAIKAAFEQAQSSMADGTMPSGGSETTQNRSGGSNTDSGDSPFSKAAGFDGTDRSSVSTQNRTKDADSSIRDDMAEFSDNALSGDDKHSMNQSTTDNDEVSDFVNRNKPDK
ncbi:P-type conjugative transfer protein TrbL [Providencia sp. PROV174]|uniref:P-type conjugative transfer protein TrbL n=1 Tax=Providencia sp. PROV174 TaxID=2949877 RepID=UPI00234A2AF6|nr:P-type conjugative transfer protein TrbL [Providencia sp. PROV174]